MATVQFNQVDEFLAELKAQTLEGEGICRLTNLYKNSGLSPMLRHMVVVATFKATDGDIVRLDRFVGTLWSHESQDKPVLDKAQEIH
ncbi:unnamed protein product, partial [marine sediment metagenome]